MLKNIPPGVELKPHQESAILKLQNGKILYGGTGVGKTHTALGYYMENEQPRDIYVITTARKRDDLDWEKVAADFAISAHDDLGVAGKIHVDSWNNIAKYRDIHGAFFIFDEQRVVGTGAWVKAYLDIARKNHWIMLSATPGDTWLDYIPVFVANGFYKNKTEFIRKHVVYTTWAKFPKVERYTAVGALVRHRNDVLVHMPYIRTTTRHPVDLTCSYDVNLFERVVNDRWHVYEDRPLRDVAELFRVMRKVVNSDQSRLARLTALMEKHPKLIVFYNFDYELEMLRTLANSESLSTEQTQTSPPWKQCSPNCSGCTSKNASGCQSKTGSGIDSTFSLAEWNGHKHQPVPTTDRWLYLVQYQAGSEAWDCIETNAICFWSLPYSYKNWFQAHGRTDRLNTEFTDLFNYYLKSDSMIDKGIWKNLSLKKSFNESEFFVK